MVNLRIIAIALDTPVAYYAALDGVTGLNGSNLGSRCNGGLNENGGNSIDQFPRRYSKEASR